MINEQTFMRYDCKKLFYIFELVGIVCALIFLGLYLIFGNDQQLAENAQTFGIRYSAPHATTFYIILVCIFVILSLLAILIVWKNVQSLMLVAFGFQVVWTIILVINAIFSLCLVIYVFIQILTFKACAYAILGFLIALFLAAFNAVLAILLYRIWKSRLMHSIERRLSPKIQKF